MDINNSIAAAGKKLTFSEVVEYNEKYYFNLFARAPICFERGEGTVLYGMDGKRYLDFLGGLAVNALGHNNPAITGAIKSQAEKFIHCTNLYYIEPQARLAKTLVDISCADRVFICNSGAEANEAAIKLAKIFHYKAGRHAKNKIVTATDSFHGRTLAMVAATGQVKYQKPYAPLLPGFSHVPLNDVGALRSAVSEEETCAIMLEVIQGESGVNIAEPAFIEAAAELCEKTGALLIFDEVQTGLGRTGKLFGYQHYGVEPDIFTLAKALGAGFPIGAMLAKERVAAAFEPGDHGSTFGGNPLACEVGNASLGLILGEKLHERAAEKGAMLMGALRAAAGDSADGIVSEVRGRGLMIAAQFKKPVAVEVKGRMQDAGCLVGSVGDSIMRMLPPLTVSDDEIKEAAVIFGAAVKAL
ncbi:MAG: aspartate aminotransferase family protein [Oscillospiraceae bacterium]|nr:aspartate aminotransferase family protein [Oscillospiraceae bacterium]